MRRTHADDGSDAVLIDLFESLDSRTLNELNESGLLCPC